MTAPQRYRRRPEIVEAMQYDGSEESAKAISEMVGGNGFLDRGPTYAHIYIGPSRRSDEAFALYVPLGWWVLSVVAAVSDDVFRRDFAPLPDAAEAERLAGVAEERASKYAGHALGAARDGDDDIAEHYGDLAADMRKIAAMLSAKEES